MTKANPTPPQGDPQWRPGAVVQEHGSGLWYTVLHAYEWFVMFGHCDDQYLRKANCTPRLPAASALDSWQAAWDALIRMEDACRASDVVCEYLYIEPDSDTGIVPEDSNDYVSITFLRHDDGEIELLQTEAHGYTASLFRTAANRLEMLQQWLAAGAPAWDAAARSSATGAGVESC